jgi:hypothetical protein
MTNFTVSSLRTTAFFFFAFDFVVSSFFASSSFSFYIDFLFSSLMVTTAAALPLSGMLPTRTPPPPSLPSSSSSSLCAILVSFSSLIEFRASSFVETLFDGRDEDGDKEPSRRLSTVNDDDLALPASAVAVFVAARAAGEGL